MLLVDYQLPYSSETEAYLLSACLVSDGAMDVALDIVKPADFYWQENQKLYALMERLHGENKVIDAGTLTAEGADSEQLHVLLETPALSTRTKDYAEQVKALATRRRVIHAGLRVIDIASSNTDADRVMDEAEAAIIGARDTERNDAPALISETLDSIDLETRGAHFGVRTHLEEVNDIIVGLAAGSFNILAARPGEGKTVMACDIARFVSRDKTVVLFSVEMTKHEIAERLIAAEGMVGLTKLRTGTLNESEKDAARRAIASLRAHQLIIDDSTSTMYDLQRKMRRLSIRERPELVIVDYIQLLRMNRKSYDSRQQEVAEISRALKLMAREYDVPVLGVSQLNRPERRYDTERSKPQKPTLASLRDSGALEQDADEVWFLHHPSENTQETEFIVAKNRSGPIGAVTLHFHPQYVTFKSIGESLRPYRPANPDSHVESRTADDMEPEELL